MEKPSQKNYRLKKLLRIPVMGLIFISLSFNGNFTPSFFLAPLSITKDPSRPGVSAFLNNLLIEQIQHDLCNQLPVISCFLDIIEQSFPLNQNIQQAEKIALHLKPLFSLITPRFLLFHPENVSFIVNEVCFNLNLLKANLREIKKEKDILSLEQQKMLNTIILCITRCHTIIRRLFHEDKENNFSLITDLTQALAEALDALKGNTEYLDFSTQSKVLEFDFSELKSIGPIYGNYDELVALFHNLLLNSVHAMPRGGKLTFKSGYTPSRGVWISITDTGKGISKDNLARIFKHGFTTEKEKGGSGIGMSSIQKTVTDLHKGDIQVQSQPNKGTTITITLKNNKEISLPDLLSKNEKQGRQTITDLTRYLYLSKSPINIPPTHPHHYLNSINFKLLQMNIQAQIKISL